MVLGCSSVDFLFVCLFIVCLFVFTQKLIILKGKKRFIFCEQKISRVQKILQLHSFRQGLKAVLYLKWASRISMFKCIYL